MEAAQLLAFDHALNDFIERLVQLPAYHPAQSYSPRAARPLTRAITMDTLTSYDIEALRTGDGRGSGHEEVERSEGDHQTERGDQDVAHDVTRSTRSFERLEGRPTRSSAPPEDEAVAVAVQALGRARLDALGGQEAVHRGHDVGRRARRGRGQAWQADEPIRERLEEGFKFRCHGDTETALRPRRRQDAWFAGNCPSRGLVLGRLRGAPGRSDGGAVITLTMSQNPAYRALAWCA